MKTTPHSRAVLCALTDLRDPGTCEFAIGEGEWPLRGFVVKHRGEVRAYVNRCPHAGYPLNWGTNNFFIADGSLLICTAHGALFEPHTGECVAGPCAGRSLRSLEIDIEDGNVLLRGALPGDLDSY